MPVGFRVYFGTNEEFDENYCWIPYSDEETNFGCDALLPENLDYDTVYYWMVVPTTEDGRGDAEDCPVWSFTSEPDTSVEDYITAPFVNKLEQNYPNPFNPTTSISFSLKNDSPVSLNIFNIKGQKVVSLLNEYKKAGNHQLVWNAKDKNNKAIASGIYFYRLEAKDYQETKKMILLR